MDEITRILGEERRNERRILVHKESELRRKGHYQRRRNMIRILKRNVENVKLWHFGF